MPSKLVIYLKSPNNKQSFKIMNDFSLNVVNSQSPSINEQNECKLYPYTLAHIYNKSPRVIAYLIYKEKKSLLHRIE